MDSYDPMDPPDPAESSRRERSALVLAFLIVIVLAVMSQGCGSSPTGPAAPGLEATYTASNPPPFVRSARSPTGIGESVEAILSWEVVATGWVDPDVEKVVAGSRYRLRFVPGSLDGGSQIVIRERTPDRIEFELGPHGSRFGEPVELTIDFAGTNADTASANYDGGGRPELYWYDEARGAWERVPGKIEGTKFVAELAHFSTYGLARGKSGW